MGLERELEKFVQQKQMEKCEFCHNKMKYEGAGRYRCSYCGMEALDDFGKLRKFLEENGPTPGGVIAQATGISIDKIDDFLRKGRVEIPNGEKFYLSCEKCGCDIRYGRYCPQCATRELKNNFHTSYQDVGEKPRHSYNADMSGKMHFVNRRGD